uniref:non-specific serine/threonine protein kinase n=1 Tax=Arcella intermedia TaxID=1963864 RepID=A0A6B2L117_9EUKA
MLETLGKGGLATVKVGFEFESGTKVAVKIVDKEKLSNPREQVSMAREITIMKLLKHKNILRLYDIYENDEKLFLILDLYEGGDLYGHLTSHGALRPEDALPLFKQIIQGIEYCHANLIVHRDLKPENLLLSADKKHLVISDFGLSTGMQGSRNLLKTRCGTVHYISPEVAKGDPYVGMASDVWSIGIILYAMVTATLPFDGPSSVAVLKKIVRGEFHMPPTLPAELQDLIRKMLNVDPKERITIPHIKLHPWYSGSKDEAPSSQEHPKDQEPLILSLQEIKANIDVISNLKLLGWEESELMDDLLSKDMNTAKVFYKLLIDHKNHPANEKKQEKPIEKKVLRRRSMGVPRSGIIGGPSSASKDKEKRLSDKKRPSLRTPISTRYPERYSERPNTRHNKDTGADKHGSHHEKHDKHDKHEKHDKADKADKAGKVGWEMDPETKRFQLESDKNITELLASLQLAFKDLQLDLDTMKQTKTGFKAKARKSTGKRKGKTEVKVNISQKEDGQSVISIEKSGTSHAQFTVLSKKIEESLV